MVASTLIWTILIVLCKQQRVILNKAFVSLVAYRCSENAEWSPPEVISHITFIHSFQLNERKGYQRLFVSRASAHLKAGPQHRELRVPLFSNSASFVHSYVQTRLKSQYNGKWPFSLFYVLKPLITPIRAINLSGGSSTSVSIFRFLLELIPRARAASILRIFWKSSSVRS